MNIVVNKPEERSFKVNAPKVVKSAPPAPVEKNYHEVDALSQLKANISQLEDLQFRLSFMMKEVKPLIRR